MRNASGDLDDITYQGNQVSDGYFAGWSLKAAETINGTNQVAWKHTSGNIAIWDADQNWNRTGTSFWGSASSAQGFQAETNFGVDLNGDGSIGVTYTDRETKGNVDLVTDSTGGAYARNSSGALDDITYQGNQMRDGYFAGWSLKAAETINGVNQVAWQHFSGLLSIWNTDANWNYQSYSTAAASSAQGFQAETSLVFLDWCRSHQWSHHQ